MYEVLVAITVVSGVWHAGQARVLTKDSTLEAKGECGLVAPDRII